MKNKTERLISKKTMRSCEKTTRNIKASTDGREDGDGALRTLIYIHEVSFFSDGEITFVIPREATVEVSLEPLVLTQAKRSAGSQTSYVDSFDIDIDDSFDPEVGETLTIFLGDY